jgi:hypothetical protein
VLRLTAPPQLAVDPEVSTRLSSRGVYSTSIAYFNFGSLLRLRLQRALGVLVSGLLAVLVETRRPHTAQALWAFCGQFRAEHLLGVRTRDSARGSPPLCSSAAHVGVVCPARRTEHPRSRVRSSARLLYPYLAALCRLLLMQLEL